MAEMSPLLRGLMLVLHKGSMVAAALMALFIAINIWQNLSPDGHLTMNRQDYGFLGIMVLLLVFALYLVRSIGRELKKPGA